MICKILRIPRFILGCICTTCVLPTIAFFLYCFGYTNNPWDMNSEMINYLTKTKAIHVNKSIQPFITNGVIITNHRCFTDFFLDPYVFSCPVIGRRIAVFASGIAGIISFFFNRTIIIDRRLDRNTIFSYVLSLGHKLFMFYPEGTRCSHVTLPENYKEITLKYGLLKSIWENSENTRIQITISKNKEKVLNEKKFKIGYGVNVYYITGNPIYTRDYSTFDEFIDKIKLDWHTLWNEVFSIDDNTILQDEMDKVDVDVDVDKVDEDKVVEVDVDKVDVDVDKVDEVDKYEGIGEETICIIQ